MGARDDDRALDVGAKQPALKTSGGLAGRSEKEEHERTYRKGYVAAAAILAR